MKKPYLLPGLILAFFLSYSHAEQWQVEKLYELDFDPISEMSGMVKSKRFSDVYWLHNDSGDTARLFAVNGQGEVLFPSFLSFHGQELKLGKKPWPGHRINLAVNYDWEDIAVDKDWIYIADTGNNGNARRDLGIYVVPEFNPAMIESSRSIRFYAFRYPQQEYFPAKQWHYDSEALFVLDNHIYLITKHRVAGRFSRFEKGANLYRLDNLASGEMNEAVLIDSHPGLFAITAADLSPDATQLAVLGYRQLSVFPAPESGDKWLSGQSRSLDLAGFGMGQIESVSWRAADSLLVGNEDGVVYLVTLPD